MTQQEINNAVAKLLKGKSFFYSSRLARRFGCQKGRIIEAFEAAERAFPEVRFMRIYGFEGGMGRA